MKKLQVSFEGIVDKTGYLFSLVKCLSAALRCSEYKDFADDIIATSGFAFRMWAAADLCPSAMSIWEFKKQKEWVENGGLICDYEERLWGQDAIEEERRLSAIRKIEYSIDSGVAAVAWDVSGCEWGLIIGYDDDTQTFATLKINGQEDILPYEKLGRLELPILSVLTVVGKQEKASEVLVTDTIKLSRAHLRGEEWCDNAKGLAAYDTILSFITEKWSDNAAWQLEYYLGTYAALKWYAWKFFEKYNEIQCAEQYKTIYEAWKEAFDIKCKKGTDERSRAEIAELLKKANAMEEEYCNFS